jgi:hypothetical protein
MILIKASKEAIKYACTTYHYAKSVPVNVMGYSVFTGVEAKNDDFCGVILFGTVANKSIASPYGLKQGEVIELVRVALNGKQSSTSKVVGIALKLIKKDVPLCKMVVSYADCDQEHIGTIYQATNWYFTGKMNVNTVSGFIINGVKRHNKSVHGMGVKQSLDSVRKYLDPKAEKFVTKGKLKYIYPLDKNMIQLCKSLSKEYPKKILTV